MTRLFDLLVSLVGLIALAPFFLIVAVLIKLDSYGPVFFKGLRVGKDGRTFRIFKFRTMVADATMRGPVITTSNDPRVTRIGRSLRRAKIDELPQLINVFRGEMSLVGPRPEDPEFVALYSQQQRRILSMCPGITSPASLHYRDEEALLEAKDWRQTYLQEILPRKLQIELEYQRHRTLLTDISLVVRTVLEMFH